MRRAASTVLLVACVVLDLAMVVLGALVLFVIVTGGGVFAVQGTTISLRSVGNPLSILAVLFLLRLPTLRTVPFLVAASPPDFFARPLRGASRVADALSALDERRAIRWTIVALLVATVLKLANAWGYPGFFSGDDVEIHEMTFRQLFQLDVDVWNLRSPFYPMTFIYPVQALMVSAGFDRCGRARRCRPVRGGCDQFAGPLADVSRGRPHRRRRGGTRCRGPHRDLAVARHVWRIGAPASRRDGVRAPRVRLPGVDAPIVDAFGACRVRAGRRRVLPVQRGRFPGARDRESLHRAPHSRCRSSS